ncbi:MAG: cation diffusion facilitator family transporter [Acetatifactor sp.]|nr:cation diffusion facilitator family transporter [Acetatifactor sp.]MDE7353336.1 cation diffusion facilitator family transporter [Acetatifactor sp.]
MIRLFARLFIKNHRDTKNPHVRQAYGVLCGALGIGLNLLLFAGKFAAGFFSHSIAVTADAFNNLSDAGSSIITLIGFRMAGQKPDPDHPFGHGRIEYISGLLVAVIILLMGFELIQGSAAKIFRPEELTFSPVVLIILAVSILVKCYMYLYNRRLGKKLDSAAMLATAADSLSDALATTLVLAATLTAHFTGLHIDGWCGVLVGLFICWTGFNAAKDTISPLLGQAPDKEFVRQVNEIVMSHQNVLGIHDLIVHNYGPGRILISLHAEVPADGNILTLHDMIDGIEHQLRDTLDCHAVIHMDPVCVNDEETNRLKSLVQGYLEEISPRLTMHDFRIVAGPTHTNLIFDVAAPYDFPLQDAELIQVISQRIRQEDPGFCAVIEVDKQYTSERS